MRRCRLRFLLGGSGAGLNIFVRCKLARISLQTKSSQTNLILILTDVLVEMDCEDIQRTLILMGIIQLLADKERYVAA